MHSLKNQENFSEEDKKGDHPREMEQIKHNYSSPKKGYKKLGSAGIEGSLYQIDLLTLVLLNGMRKVKNWRLSTEDKAAAQLDDLIFEYLPSGSAILLQAKHKKDEEIEITYADLMSVNKNSEFSLSKYFFSYQEVKSSFNVQNVIICSNVKLDEKTKNILREESVDSDSVMHFEGAENICYGFSGCSLPRLEEIIKKYQAKNLKNKELTITDEHINDFLNHLKFFPNCLSDKNVENIIQQTISQVQFSKDLNSKMIQIYIKKKMMDWFKEEKGRYLTEVEAKAFFCDLRSNKYCEDLKLYDIRFKGYNLPLILQTQQNEKKGKKKRQQSEHAAPIKETKPISHIIPDKEYMLNVVKIYQALPTHHKDQTLFVNPEETFEIQRQIIDAFEAQYYTTLVMVNNRIEETAVKEICDKVINVLTTHKYKHVVLIAEEKNDLAIQLKHANVNHYEVIPDSITFADLEETTQEKFKRKKLVNFQGRTMSLEELITPSTEADLNEIVNSNMLVKLARGDKFEVGLELPHPDNYYINRSFNRNDQKLPEEELWHSTEEKVILISDSAGMGKSCVLTSLGISIKSDNPHLWVIRMNLNNYTSIMKTALAEGRKSVSIVDLLNSQEASKFKNEFGKKLITTPKRVVLMLDGVDEISPAYTELVINLIRTSLAQGNFVKIFVTTRPHMYKELKEIPELHSFTSEPYSRNHQEEIADLKFFTLEPFSKANQINFLVKYWTETLDLQDGVRKNRCNIFAEALIENVSVWINEKVRNNFAGIPLQIRMLAEIFQERNEISDEELEWEGCKEFSSSSNEEINLPTRFDLTQLYKLFIDKKCDIFIKTSNPAGQAAAEEALKDKVEKCQEYHRALALKVIFDSEKWDLFTCYTNVEWPIPSRFEDNFLFRVGIVQRQGENIEFLHRTFAEFFVADCLLIELERKPTNKNLQQFFMESILLWKEFYVVRAFLDSRMQNVWHLIENNFRSYFHRNRISEELLTRYFRACAREGCAKIMECLIKCIDKEQLKTLSNAVNKLHLMYDALNLATQYDHWNILKLLLELNEKFNKGKDAHKLFLAFVVIYAVNNNIGTFQFLSRKVDESDENILGRSAPELNEVVFMGRFGKVELWMEKGGADINIKENIRGAVFMSRLEAIKFVMEEIGFDINTKDNNGETALHIAAYWGTLEIVKYLVEKGADVNVKNNEGETAILRAAYLGKLEIVKYLVEEAGADQNVKDNHSRSVLDLAGLMNKLEIVKYLLDEALSDKNVKHIKGETALHEAALMGNLEIVKYLVEKAGADKNVKDSKGDTPLHEAAHWGKLEIVKYLVEEAGADKDAENNEGKTALHEAAFMDKLEIVKYLVEEAGADENAKNSKGGTALHEAALSGNLEIVKYLVEITGTDVNITNNEGDTALHEAAFMGKLETVKYLVEAGADKNVKNSEGETALHEAASMDKLEIVKYLVDDARADKNVKNNEGETALHEAAFMGKLEIVKYLVEAGADKNVKNNEGETALHKATFMGKLEIVKYLVEEAGADKNVKNGRGDTALHEAAHMGELEIVKYLVEDVEADKNIKNSEGETALHTAAHQGELEIVKYLVEEAGANRNIKNNQGKKALRLAADEGYWKVVRFLSNSNRWVMLKMRVFQFFQRKFQ